MIAESTYMRDARLAEDRARAAEKREQALLDKLREFEYQASLSSIGSGMLYLCVRVCVCVCVCLCLFPIC